MRILLLISILVFMGISAQAVFAQENGLSYTPVVQIPGLDPNTQDTQQYVNALYLLAVTIAALLAVVKIIFGGVKWMLSDIVTDKASAKKDIQGAIFGLLIVLGTVLILNTIDPNLTRLNFLENATPLNVNLKTPDGGTSTPVTPIEPGTQRFFGPGSKTQQDAYRAGCASGNVASKPSGRGVYLTCNK